VASSEPIKNSILSGFVNTPFGSFFLFHKIPQPRLYLYNSARGSIILRRAVGAAHGLSFKKTRAFVVTTVNPGELRLLQLTSFLLLVCRKPIAPVYSASLG
jgi:hypothetical protein